MRCRSSPVWVLLKLAISAGSIRRRGICCLIGSSSRCGLIVAWRHHFGLSAGTGSGGAGTPQAFCRGSRVVYPEALAPVPAAVVADSPAGGDAADPHIL